MTLVLTALAAVQLVVTGVLVAMPRTTPGDVGILAFAALFEAGLLAVEVVPSLGRPLPPLNEHEIFQL